MFHPLRHYHFLICYNMCSCIGFEKLNAVLSRADKMITEGQVLIFSPEAAH